MSDWRRVTRDRHCPICDKPDWCLVAGPADNPTAAICARIESEKRCGDAGWLHRLGPDSFQPSTRTVLPAAPTESRDFGELAVRCTHRLQSHQAAQLSAELGVSVAALRKFRLGWSVAHRAFTFPMSDAAGKVVGIRLRRPDGRKLSVRGGRDGAFIPSRPSQVEQLFITEGPTDAAAMVDMGLNAIGRPSCSGGSRMLVAFIQSSQPASVVIVCDADGPGRRGGESLGLLLSAYCERVRVITPPSGFNDLRDWKRGGGASDDVAAVVAAAPIVRLRISTAERALHGRKRKSP